MRYFKAGGVRATEAYVRLARDHGLEPSQMALAFVNSRRFLTANIIGATTEKQLKSNLDTEDITLSDEVMAGIEAIHTENSNPAP
jgi:aryl-alcohol dehydrogenase-like predicted oxidoreductase